MSNSVFPNNLVGLDVKVEREAIYSTTIHTAVSGKEQRASWQSTPRYKYTLTYNILRSNVNAPAPNQAQTETGIILKFLDDHHGAFDSFLFTDPYDGTQRRVRFQADSLKLETIAENMYALKKLELVSVK